MSGPPLDRCYWLRDGDEWIVIPACFGTAINGPEQCTCDVAGSRLEQADTVRRSAEAEVERLRDRAHARHEYAQMLFNENKQLRRRVEELEAIVAETLQRAEDISS